MHLLRIAAFSLFAVAGLLTAMLLLGATQPRDHTVSATVTLHAPLQTVWNRITDVQAQPGWRPTLTAVAAYPSNDAHPCWTETTSLRTLPLCETLADPPSSRVIRTRRPALSFSGNWTFSLWPVDGQTTRLTLTERGSTASLLWRFVNHFVVHEDTGIKRYESDLQKSLLAPPPEEPGL